MVESTKKQASQIGAYSILFSIYYRFGIFDKSVREVVEPAIRQLVESMDGATMLIASELYCEFTLPRLSRE
jgi:hypothetical protein